MNHAAAIIRGLSDHVFYIIYVDGMAQGIFHCVSNMIYVADIIGMVRGMDVLYMSNLNAIIRGVSSYVFFV